jgi:hypothetical protein
VEQAPPVERSHGSLRGGSGPAAALAAAVLGVSFYLVAFGVRDIRMPPGDDAMYWVLALRLTARLGLVGPQLAARPVFPLVGSVLGTATGASAWTMAAVAPIVFAAATGLAGAAIASRFGVRGWHLALFGFLAGVSGIVARLVAGKDENLMALWLLGAAVAVPAWSDGGSAGRRRRASLAGAAVLAAAATMVEWPLAAVFGGIVAVAWGAAWLVSRRSGEPGATATAEEPLRVLLIATLAGLAVGAIAIVLVDRTGPGSGIANLPPDYRYSARLRDELALIWPWLTGALTVLGVAAAWDRERRPPAVSVLAAVWLVGTAIVVAAGWLGAPGPTYRALTIALPVALATAGAVFLPLRWRGGTEATTAGRGAWGRGALAVAIGAAALVPGISLWWHAQLGTQTSPGQVAELTAAVRYAQSLPHNGPVVVVVGRPILPFAESLLYRRMAADVAPANTNGGVLIFVGNARDALAGWPSPGEDPAQTRVFRQLFAPLRSALAAGAPVLSGRLLDPDGYAAAVGAGAPTVGGGILAVTRGPAPSQALKATISVDPLPSAWRMFLVAMEMFVLFALAGIGWAPVAMRWAGRDLHWLVAPAFGATAMSIVAFVLVHLGVKPSGWGAWLCVGVALAASLLAWMLGRPSEPSAPEPSPASSVASSPLR